MSDDTNLYNHREKIRQMIILQFYEKVRGKKSDTSASNDRHDGREGHWLETQMGILHNAKNEPDIMGFEMKNITTSKTTFGDWSANYYIYKDSWYGITRDDFLRIFGKPNADKGNRHSWSGEPCPKINIYNTFGQMMVIDEENNIVILYNFQKDQRHDKSTIVPSNMQKADLIIAKWEAAKIQLKLERKFNKLGWFKCIKNSDGFYSEIVFGDPISFASWIRGVKEGDIFFDSGMYQGNKRPYSQWRANNSYWETLVSR